MNHHCDFSHLHYPQSWVTIGVFDGIHTGHQQIIKNMVNEASEIGMPTGVITFYPHPEVLFKNIREPFYLTSPEQRARLISNMGVDYILTLKFDREMASQHAEDFIQKIHHHLGIQGLWAGNDFALGKNREGTLEKIQSIGEWMGFFVRNTPTAYLDGKAVSSSLIRSFLRTGDIHNANRFLGRHYTSEGKIIKGLGRGRLLGTPTANLESWENQILPKNGVYASIITHQNNRYPGVTNIGLKPTFAEMPSKPIIETYIFDFDHDLYGQSVELEYVAFLRDEIKFPNREALISQINQDVLRAKEVLSNES